jgi:hypothetical protein
MSGTFGSFPVTGITATLFHPGHTASPYYWLSDPQRYTFGSMLYWYFGMRCTTDPVNGGPGWTIDYWESSDGINYGTAPYASSNSLSIPPTAEMIQVSITCGASFNWVLHIADFGSFWTWTITP